MQIQTPPRPKSTRTVMKTTLPDLPYSPTGIVWTEGVHSSAYSPEREYPRTDLQHFTHWEGFETEIHDVINTHMGNMNILPGAEYAIGSMPKKPKVVREEEGVRREASVQLHDLVLEVLEILGIEGSEFLGSTSGNKQIIGVPDFSWLRQNILHPLFFAEYKTIWAAPLVDLPLYRRQENPSVRERQSIAALYQLYGYMTFNDTKYGVLSNLQRAWFFQRVEGGRFLEYYGPVSIDSARSPSMLKAFVGIILLANNFWFHSSPTSPRFTPARYFGSSSTAVRDRHRAIMRAQNYRSRVVAGSYNILQLDPRLCHFNRSSVRHTPRHGFTLQAKLETGLLRKEEVFCKVIDIFQTQASIARLDREVRNYATLTNLQGVAIPRVRGYYDIWGLLRLLVLEDVGTAISEGQRIGPQMRTNMKAALSHIHSAGYVHGDIARRNFCTKGSVVCLVDLETLAQGTPVQMATELVAIDAL